MKRKVQAAVAKNILARVPPHVSFWLCTNENLRGLAEVSDSLQHADDEVFRYHVNRDKNDFEAWIRDVIKDKDLAREIARVKTRETLIRKITERVDELRTVIKRSDSRKPERQVRAPKSRPKKRSRPKTRAKTRPKKRSRSRKQ